MKPKYPKNKEVYLTLVGKPGSGRGVMLDIITTALRKAGFILKQAKNPAEYGCIIEITEKLSKKYEPTTKHL